MSLTVVPKIPSASEDPSLQVVPRRDPTTKAVGCGPPRLRVFGV